MAEEGAATLLAVMKIKKAGEDDPSYARLDAVRLMFDVLHKDTGGDP